MNKNPLRDLPSINEVLEIPSIRRLAERRKGRTEPEQGN